jgi:hypothetical protein
MTGHWRVGVMVVVLVALSAPSSRKALAQDAEWRYRRLDMDVAIDPSGRQLEIQGRRSWRSGWTARAHPFYTTNGGLSSAAQPCT